MKKPDSPQVLLVEDSEGDVEMLRLFLESARPSISWDQVTRVSNGEAAMDALMRQGDFAGREPFDLMLLDLHIPLKTGLEVLEAFSLKASRRPAPVVIIVSTSTRDTDRKRARELGVKHYVVKDIGIEQFEKDLHEAVRSALAEGAAPAD
jgi:CheY-like chemotaxis protein